LALPHDKQSIVAQLLRALLPLPAAILAACGGGAGVQSADAPAGASGGPSGTPEPTSFILPRLATSNGYSLAVKADGSVFAWGSLVPSSDSAPVPGSQARQISGVGGASKVYALSDDVGTYGRYALVVQASGSAVGWGTTGGGLGLGVAADAGGLPLVTIPNPTRIAALGTVEDARLLPNGSTLARRADGSLWLLGGQVVEDNVTHVRTVSALQLSSLAAVTSVGSAIAADPSASAESVQVPVVEAGGAVKFITITNALATPAVAAGNTLVYTAAYTVSPMAGVANIVKVMCSSGFARYRYHCLALDSQGTVWSWGTEAMWGEIGDGTLEGKLAPVPLSGLPRVKDVAAGELNSYALTATGQVYSWGLPQGLGSVQYVFTSNLVPHSVPALVPSLSSVEEIAVGGGNVLLRLADGSVWGWGPNLNGELGNGTATQATLPVRALGVGLN
jgi:hypothetical protein